MKRLRSAFTSLVLLAGGVLLIGACDFDRPGDDASVARFVLRPFPRDGARDVPRRGRIVVRADRLLLPRSVSAATVRVRSGSVIAAGVVRFMPVAREIWIDLDPTRPLDPDIDYAIEMHDLVDLDGNVLAEPFATRFHTGRELGEAPLEPAADPAAVAALFTERCATSACHDATAAAAGLDLSSSKGVTRTAIGAPSRIVPANPGEQGARGALSLAALRIIDVVAGRGSPDTSLLIYKVLGDVHVPGEPMPPTGEPLSAAELAQVSAWIVAGAPAP